MSDLKLLDKKIEVSPSRKRIRISEASSLPLAPPSSRRRYRPRHLPPRRKALENSGNSPISTYDLSDKRTLESRVYVRVSKEVRQIHMERALGLLSHQTYTENGVSETNVIQILRLIRALITPPPLSPTESSLSPCVTPSGLGNAVSIFVMKGGAYDTSTAMQSYPQNPHIALAGCLLIGEVCDQISSNFPSHTKSFEDLSLVLLSSIGLVEAIMASRWNHLSIPGFGLAPSRRLDPWRTLLEKDSNVYLALSKAQPWAMEGLKRMGWPASKTMLTRAFVGAGILPERSLEIQNQRTKYLQEMQLEENKFSQDNSKKLPEGSHGRFQQNKKIPENSTQNVPEDIHTKNVNIII